MDFTFTADQLAIRDSVAKLCARFGDDYWLQHDREASFPHEFSNAFAEAGWFGAVFPEECGGAALGMTEAVLIMQEVGRLGLAACSSIHMNMFGTMPIVKYGSAEQKARFLPPIIDGRDRACFGVTEPNAGLNTTQIRTFAKRVGERYIVNGHKVWTSTAQVANKILLLTRTASREASARPTDGMTLFYTDLNRERIDVRKIEKLGRAAVDSNELFIVDLEVPIEDRIGEEGKGFSYLLSGLNSERILVAAGFLGAARYCLDRAAQYAKERVVFDRPIGQNQAIQHPLARGWIDCAAAELLLFKAAALYDQGQPCGLECNAAKLLCAEAFFDIAQRAVRTHGGYGYAKEFHVERYFRESILPLIAPVSQELILCHIAERALGLPKSY
ncbi:MAG: acyl-CoA/acyl-ACP dehydrogenase [Burkholderiales bacterium]|nr:acyl-CoA/acyl-ACP dehydrogenase [Burkholderiales bacterium]